MGALQSHSGALSPVLPGYLKLDVSSTMLTAAVCISDMVVEANSSMTFDTDVDALDRGQAVRAAVSAVELVSSSPGPGEPRRGIRRGCEAEAAPDATFGR